MNFFRALVTIEFIWCEQRIQSHLSQQQEKKNENKARADWFSQREHFIEKKMHNIHSMHPFEAIYVPWRNLSRSNWK